MQRRQDAKMEKQETHVSRRQSPNRHVFDSPVIVAFRGGASFEDHHEYEEGRDRFPKKPLNLCAFASLREIFVL
jgi:hypothetical protein